MGIIRTKSHTPPPKRPNVPAQQASSSVAHPSLRATPWFCFRLFSCVVPVVSRQVSRPKEKKKVKKRGKEKGKKKKDFFFFRVKEQRQASYSSRPCVGRFLDSRLGRTKEKKRENLGLPAFSTKSACSRMKVNFSLCLVCCRSSPHALAATRAAVLCSSLYRVIGRRSSRRSGSVRELRVVRAQLSRRRGPLPHFFRCR